MPEPIDWGFALPYYVSALFGGYLLGSFPTGVVLSKLFGFVDLRSVGSGNIGATNALRTGNKLLALGTLLGDSGKAALSVWLGSYFGEQTAILAAVGSLLGHLYPVWLGFKGGKGIAVYIGALSVLFYPLALIFILVWVLTAFFTRYSSLAALLAVSAMPLGAIYFEAFQLRDLCILFLVLVFYTHRENVVRLWRGEESKIGKKDIR